MVKIFLLVKILLASVMSKAALDCDEDWTEFDSFCYKVMNTSGYYGALSWVKALRGCLGLGGNLVSVTNNMEMKFVYSLSLQLKNDSAWIGLFYWFQKGGYVWSDGTPFNNSIDINWLSDIPSSLRGLHCVVLLSYGWNRTDCYQKNQYYICERRKGRPSCPADWFPNGLSCYKHDKRVSATWNIAQKQCIASGGHLVQMDDDDEEQFMIYYMYLTGLTKVAKHIWIGQKNNEKCVQMDTGYSGARVEESCDKHNYYVCEKPVSWPGNSCYQCPSNTSSADITVNCTFPENLCFKYGHRAGKQEKVIVQGCMSAEQCGRKENKHLECCEGDLCNKEISCYQCSSNVSLDDCTKNQEIVDCPLPVHHCAKMEYKTKSKDGKLQTRYYKRCTTTEQCIERSDMRVDCCSDDKCNADLGGPRCYECANAVTTEECPVRQCIFTDGQCFSAWTWKRQGPSVKKIFKFGCTKQHDCGKTVNEYFIQCCNGSWCNRVNRVNKFTELLPRDSNSVVNTIIYVSCGVAFILLLLLLSIIGFRCYKKLHHKRLERSARSRREIIPLDKWEILPEYDQIEFEEELGRGAFGVVHKATFTKRVGIEVFYTGKRMLNNRKKAQQIVAVKVLKDNPTEAQKEEFMFEIEQMKLLGSHKNIVSMVGCCTLQKEKFLVIEYVPFGDLLTWLRRRRKAIVKNEASEQLYANKEVLNDGERNREFDKENKVTQEQVSEGHQIEGKVKWIPLQEIGEENKVILEQLEENDAKGKVDSGTMQDNCDVVMDMASPAEKLLENKDVSRKVEKDRTSCSAAPVNIVLSPPRDNKDVVLEMTPSTSVKDDEHKKFLAQDLLTIPTTSQAKSQTSAMFLSTESLVEDEFEEEESFSTQQLFTFAWQIAKGMNHLAEKNLVHRDLAARNVLVGNDNRVKVSDFGLMRQIYQDAYSSRRTKKLPVKWMAPESLQESVFTVKSDVWAYGVLLWEMATLGGVPYPTFTNTELFRLLQTGYRMERPDMCSDEVHELMTECWKQDPSSRPSFLQLIEKLEVIMQRDVPYCDLGKHDESSPHYNVPPGTSNADERK